jgi:hypothetical protein
MGSIGGPDLMEKMEIVCAIQVSNPISSVVQSAIRRYILHNVLIYTAR